MYLILLPLHSLIRWFVLLSLLFAIYRGFRGWLFNKTYAQVDDISRAAASIAAHIQLIIGLWLYFVSPIVSYFLHNFKDAIHERQIRFFGMEHITMMGIAIILISIGSAKAKGKTTDQEKFKTIAIWFTVALLLILSSIPWSFSPLISRPMFRAF